MKLVKVTVTATALAEFKDNYDVIKNVDKFIIDNCKDILYPKGRFELVGWKTEECI